MPDLSTFLPCPERFKRKGPHELAGPCPACGGRDRFLVWPDRPRGGAYLCRQCGARGDGIQFLRDFCRLSYADACRTLGLASGEGMRGMRGTTGRGRRPARPTGTRAAQTGMAPFVPSAPEIFPPAVLPPDAWREQAGAFLAGLCAVEGSPEAAAGICAARFLRPDTCRALGVGWNGADTFPTRQAWGLPPLEDRRKLLLPRGIVIATRRKAGVVALAIRVPDEDRQDGKRPKYWQVAGSANVPFVAGRAGVPVVLVESALDACLVWQESQASVAAVALMGNCKGLDADTADFIRAAPRLIACPDNDAGGQSAWLRWRDLFPAAACVPSAGGKDLGDMHRAALALEPVPTIAQWLEVALSSPVKKARIAALSHERGADDSQGANEGKTREEGSGARYRG